MLPDPVDGYVERAELASLCDLGRQRLTIVNAPGGFGKTTLLADACSRFRSRRGIAAWLTIDEHDDSTTLATYLPFAFAEAGLDILDSRVASNDFEHGDYRINLLLHSIEVHGLPCVLALDDVDRLQDHGSLEIVNRLLRRGPPNLHMAMTFRELPPSVDVGALLLDDRGVAISVENLRFRKRDIARFFDGRLSRRELEALNEDSQGWPVALCIHRNERAGAGADESRQGIASNWIDARLWRGLSSGQQDLVLDVGLFEWIDNDLVDDVLGSGSVRRVQSITALTGLLRTAGGSSDVLTLHPLVRRYCENRRLHETPDRYRHVHRRIADALARRGRVIAAMRHAARAGDPDRVGEILEAAGGTRFWLRHGRTDMGYADELLSNEILARFPRLGLSRCMLQVMAGESRRARTTYEDLQARTAGFTRDRAGGNDRDLHIDNVMYRYLVSTCGCQPVGTPQMGALASSIRDVVDGGGADPFVKAGARYAMGSIEAARADFGEAWRWASRARTELVRHSRYLTMFADFLLGGIAMAQGRVADAAAALGRAQRASRGDFLQDPGPAVIAEILLGELNLERSRTASLARRRPPGKPALLEASGSDLDVYSASAEINVEFALREGGAAAALDVLGETAAFAARTERPTLSRTLLGLRIPLLIMDGRTAEARETWDAQRLPQGVAELVDLQTQTWREMEAVACAGVRLLTARRRFHAARERADALIAVCTEKGLRRTLMRARVLAMVLEHRAGDADAAAAHLVAYLKLYGDTDYSKTLMQERETGLSVLAHLEVGGVPDPYLRDVAASLKRLLENGPDGQSETIVVPALSAREQQILQRLDRWRDKEIGAALALSSDGVRYHVKKLFKKLGVHSRFEATRRARALGILPAGGEETDSGRSGQYLR